MARYEVSDGTSHKFWEITLAGKTFTVRWGRIGSRGQSIVKHFVTEPQARSAYDKLIAEKRRKGYRLVAGTEEPEARPEKRPEQPVITRAQRNPALEAAVIADPTDEAALLVLGDWLQTQNDPRGELIILQHAFKHETDTKRFLERKAAADEHYRRYEPELLGSLYPWRHLFKLEWHVGFIRTARLSLDAATVSDPRLGELFAQLAVLPAALALQELTLGNAGTQVLDHGRYQAVLEQLHHHRPAALRTLHLGDFWPGTRAPEDALLGDLSELGSSFARLRRLVINGGELALGDVVLPELRNFDHRADVRQRTLAWLDERHGPNLEQLALCCRSSWFDDLEDLLDEARFPRLRQLRLLETGCAGAICDALAGTALLRQLEVLDLADGAMEDADASRLIERWGEFRHLKTFHLGQQHLTYGACKRLRAHTTVKVLDPKRYGSS